MRDRAEVLDDEKEVTAMARPKNTGSSRRPKSAEEATANWAEGLSKVTGVPPEIIARSEAGRNYTASQVQRGLPARKKKARN